MGLHPAGSLEVRVQVANVQCAWNNASTRVQRAAEIEAELDTKEHVKPLVNSEWLAMKAGLEKTTGHLEERVTPAKEYIEKKLEELETGEHRAEADRNDQQRGGGARFLCPTVGHQRGADDDEREYSG